MDPREERLEKRYSDGLATRAEVYKAIDSERDYQLRKWGDLDRRNSIGDFLIYMQRELDKAINAYYSPDEPRGAMDAIRKVTTVGVAAMERFGAPPRTTASMFICFMLALPFLFACGGNPKPAPQPQPSAPVRTVAALVRDTDGRVVSQAACRIQIDVEPGWIDGVSNDKDGYVKWDGVFSRIRSTNVQCTKPGYEPFLQRIELKTGDNEDIPDALVMDPIDVDPSIFSLQQLANIRGAMWTSRWPLPWGPRPNQPDNILSLADASFNLSKEELEPVLHHYHDEEGYTHAVIGPVGNASYHGQYPPPPNFLADPDRYWDIQQNWWNHHIAPVNFVKPDNWSCEQLESLTSFYSSPRAQKLVRIVVWTGWEPDGRTPNSEYACWAQWAQRVFPNALRLMHLIADFDAPGNDADFSPCAHADGSPFPYAVPPCDHVNTAYIGNDGAWRTVAPYTHGFLVQNGGYATSRNSTPTDGFKAEFCKQFQPETKGSLANRFTHGYAGWPMVSAWGPNKGIDVYAGEYAAYGSYWDNFPEHFSRELGDLAMSCGARGYLDGGTVAVTPR